LVIKPVHHRQEMRHIRLRDCGDGSGGRDIQPLPGTSFVSAFTPENERQALPECLIWRDRIDKWWDDGIRRDSGSDTHVA